MKPIKNVFAACDGSKKGYSVNGSESTLMLVGQKMRRRQGSSYVRHFKSFRLFSKDSHRSSGDCSAR